MLETGQIFFRTGLVLGFGVEVRVDGCGWLSRGFWMCLLRTLGGGKARVF